MGWEYSSYFSLFNSTSRQHYEVWASQYPFTILRTVPPSETCLYGHINWSLSQAQYHSSLGLSQSSSSGKGGRTRPWTGFQFNVQKWPVPESSGGSMVKKPHSNTRTESHLSGSNSSGSGSSTSFSKSKKKGNQGGCHSWWDTVINFLHIIFFHCVGWYPSPIFRSVQKQYSQ